jgi:hypothetical protein
VSPRGEAAEEVKRVDTDWDWGEGHELVTVSGKVARRKKRGGDYSTSIRLVPEIPLSGGTVSVRLRLNEKGSDGQFLGVGTEGMNMGYPVGRDKYGWGVKVNGRKVHNQDWTKYTRPIPVGQTVTVELDRVKGTLAIIVDGEHKGTAFEDEFFKTGQLFFCASLYANDYYEIEPSSWEILGS